jgi:hypothetical protein
LRRHSKIRFRRNLSAARPQGWKPDIRGGI